MPRAGSSRAAFRVRRAARTDLAALHRLLGDFQAEGAHPRRGVHPSTRTALRRGRAPGLRLFVALDADGAAVGFASAWRALDLGDGPGVWLSDLYVAPSARRSGVGRALMAAVARDGLAAGAEWMTWHVGRTNAAARRFYASLGAEERPRHLVASLTKATLSALGG